MLEVRGDTTFVTLPEPLQREITGGCQCPYCKAHPTKKPKWDTLATDGKSSWVVHHPELSLAGRA